MEGKGRRGAEWEGRGGKIDSDAQFEQGRRLANWPALQPVLKFFFKI